MRSHIHIRESMQLLSCYLDRLPSPLNCSTPYEAGEDDKPGKNMNFQYKNKMLYEQLINSY